MGEVATFGVWRALNRITYVARIGLLPEEWAYGKPTKEVVFLMALGNHHLVQFAFANANGFWKIKGFFCLLVWVVMPNVMDFLFTYFLWVVLVMFLFV
jgi:hypothetical protein